MKNDALIAQMQREAVQPVAMTAAQVEKLMYGPYNESRASNTETVIAQPNPEPQQDGCRYPLCGCRVNLHTNEGCTATAQQDGLQGAAAPRSCETCAHAKLSVDDYPCRPCEYMSRWEAPAAAPAYEPLTDVEIDAVEESFPHGWHHHEFARAVESAVLARIGARVEMETANHVHSASGDLGGSYDATGFRVGCAAYATMASC